MERFLAALLCLFGLALPLTAQNSSRSSSADPGVLRDGLYRNRALGFSYQLPYGWVDRTAGATGDKADPAKAEVLLAAFERPPEAAREAVNSAVTISVERLSSYPGLKTAADYFGPVTELTKSMGLSPVSDPYDVKIGSKSLVRGDYKKDMGQATMYWTSLAMIAREQVVLFTFVASSEGEIHQLVGRLSFAAAAGTKR